MCQIGLYFQAVDDEIEASIREVNKILGELPTSAAGGASSHGDSVNTYMHPLLNIEHKYAVHSLS